MKAIVINAEWKPKKGYPISRLEEDTRTAFDSSKVWKNPILEIRELPIPQISSKDVLLRVMASGICGSDISMYKSDDDGYMHYGSFAGFPRIIGHELVGLVEEKGDEVKDLTVGDIVTIDNVVWCNRCDPCRNGYFNACENQSQIGLTIDGGLANYIAVESKQCWKVNDLITNWNNKREAYLAAALIEPLTISYQAMLSLAGGPRLGGVVVVFGAGTIGSTAILIARAAGARVVCFDVVEEKLEIARQLGAEFAFNSMSLSESGSSSYKKVMEITSGKGADMLVEATGSEKVMPEIMRCLGVGGKVVSIGISSKETSVNLFALQAKQARLFGSIGHAGTGSYPGVINLLASGIIEIPRLLKIVTKTCGIDDVPLAMKETIGGKGIKTIVEFL